MKRTTVLLSACALGATLAFSATSAHATIAMQNAGHSEVSGHSNSGTVGWGFSTSSAINVTHLGLWDDDNDGFATGHEMAIFRLSDASIVAGTHITFPAGACSQTGGFCYVALGSSVLLAPDSYAIGAMFFAGSADLMLDELSGSAAVPTMAPGLTFLGGRVDVQTAFSMPDFFIGPPERSSYFGPNFQFEAAAVPEPLATAIAGLPLVLALARRRKASR